MRHRAYCAEDKNILKRKALVAKAEIREALKSRLLEYFGTRTGFKDKLLDQYARDICERKIDPYMVADIVLSQKEINFKFNE